MRCSCLCICMSLICRQAASFLRLQSPRSRCILTHPAAMTTISNPKPVFSTPSDPSFVHPPSDFPSLDIFDQSLEYPALVIPARRTAEIRNRLSHVILHRPRTKSVYPVVEDTTLRKVVLKQDPDVFHDDVVQDLLKTKECQQSTHVLNFGYKDWTVDEVLELLLPVPEVPSAFETVGHIAHVNLRDDVLPFKYIVGRVILDKNAPRIQTVVNKLGSIESEYRTFGMEVLAGRDDDGWSIVHLKEEGCQYELDFRQVYWNSRLGGEHRRLVRTIQIDQRQSPHDKVVVADLMAGIGPFAVPLTAHNATNVEVYANDLNPASYKYLKVNSKKNKCNNLHCYRMDGRAFVHYLCDNGIDFSHVIMNLPASAPEFLNAFRGFTGTTLPRIHVHCFGGKDDDASDQAIQRCANALGCPLAAKEDHVTVHIVRDVAPNKNMLCVSFKLPEKARALPRIPVDTQDGTKKLDDEPYSKRVKI